MRVFNRIQLRSKFIYRVIVQSVLEKVLGLTISVAPLSRPDPVGTSWIYAELESTGYSKLSDT